MVGGYSLLDSADAEYHRRQQAASTSSVPIAQSLAEDANAYSAWPAPLNQIPLGPLKYFAKKYPSAVQHVGMIYGQQTNHIASTFIQAVKSVGWKFSYTRGYGVTETNFLPDAVKMKAAGVQLVFDFGSGFAATTAAFLKATQQASFHPIEVQENNYFQSLYQLAGASANGANFPFSFSLFAGEDAARNPAVRLMDKWVHKVDPSYTAFSTDSMFGWTSAEMFVDALKQAGTQPTRASLVAALNKETAFSGQRPRSRRQTWWPVSPVSAGCWPRWSTANTSGYPRRPRQGSSARLAASTRSRERPKPSSVEAPVSEFLSLLIAGIVTGSVYAVTATGLVVTYSTTGIFNFAQGAIGMFLAYLFWQLWQAWHLPTLLSLAICLLVVAPLAGLLIERFIMRSLYRASTAVSLVVTPRAHVVVGGGSREPLALWTQSYSMPEFFSGDQVTINGIAISYEQLLTVGLTPLVAIGLRRRLHFGPAPASQCERWWTILSWAPTLGGVGWPGVGNRLDSGHRVGRCCRHPAGPDNHERHATHRAGHLRLCRRHRRSPSQPPTDVRRRHGVGDRQFVGHRLRARLCRVDGGPTTAHGPVADRLGDHARGASRSAGW